jgi:hypothetical protein
MTLPIGLIALHDRMDFEFANCEVRFAELGSKSNRKVAVTFRWGRGGA